MSGRFLDALDFHLKGPDSRIVVLDAPLRWRGDQFIMVPVRFECDLASVPKWLSSLAPPWQQSARPGVLHDYLFRYGGYHAGKLIPVTRKTADGIFYEALRSEGVGRFRAWAMYRAVRRFAGIAWRNYREGKPETR